MKLFKSFNYKDRQLFKFTINPNKGKYNFTIFTLIFCMYAYVSVNNIHKSIAIRFT